MHTRTYGNRIKKELTSAMGSVNIVDKNEVCVKNNHVIVGYLPHGKSGRFSKMILYFLRANKYAECKVIINGKKLILVMAGEYKCLLVEDFWNKK